MIGRAVVARTLLLSLSLGGLGVVVACVGDDPDATAGGDGGGGGAAADGGDLSPPPPADCDPSFLPDKGPCNLHDVDGVFVSATASGGGIGTRAEPLTKIGDGLLRAKASGKRRVFVCAGNYPEALVLDAATTSISVYGGFDCATWMPSATVDVRVKPSAPGYALRIDQRNDAFVVQAMSFEVVDATQAGESSIAAFISRSTKVDFINAKFNSGKGANGANGVPGAEPTRSNLLVAATLVNNSTLEKTCTCKNGSTSTGGRGGTAGATTGGNGREAIPVDPLFPDCTGQGGPRPSTTTGYYGAARIAVAAGGVVDPANVGTIDPQQGFITAPGGDGAFGGAGQGGGGGGYGLDAAGENMRDGMGGACGGCGGAGGMGGRGGGASIALLVHSTPVTIQNCALVASTGGDGGGGGDGEGGQIGGLFVPGVAPFGGTGGAGAGGGGGAGGTGGLSAGIVYSGPAPKIDGAEIPSAPTFARITISPTPSEGGAAGKGGPLANSTTSGLGKSAGGLIGAPGPKGKTDAVVLVQ